MTLQDYKKALDPNSEIQRVDIHVIRSRDHTPYTETINKKIFNPKEVVERKSKRQVLSNGIDTLPWGYKGKKK